MGDVRFAPFYERVRDAEDPLGEIRHLGTGDVIAALAGAGAADDPYLANVLATEAQNRSLERERVFASMGDAVFVVGLPEGVIRDVNPAAADMFGYESAELRGLPVGALHVDAAQAQEFERLLDAEPGGGARHLEFEMRRKDGLRVAVEHTVTDVVDPVGERRGRILIMRDVSARRRAEAQLSEQARSLEGIVENFLEEAGRRRSAEHRFRGLLEAAPDAIVIVDDRGAIVLVNAHAEALFGYAREELVGRSVEVLMPRRFWREHVGRGAPRAARGLELTGLRKGGRELPVEVSFSPLETDEGVWFVSAIRDASDRRRVEQLLRWQQDLLQGIVGLSSRAVVVMVEAGGVAFANGLAREVLGFPPDAGAHGDAQGEWGPAVQVPGFPPEGWADALDRALDEGVGARAVRLVSDRPGGGQLVVCADLVPVGNEAGGPAAVIVAFDVFAGPRDRGVAEDRPRRLR